MALRSVWVLEKLQVRDKSKLDRFYFYWLRSLSLTVATRFVGSKLRRAIYKAEGDFIYFANAGNAAATAINAYDKASYSAACAAVYAVAAFDSAAEAIASTVEAMASSVRHYAPSNLNLMINQLNADLNSNGSLINTPLWNDEFQINTPPNLPGLASFWNIYLFLPALTGDLYQTPESQLFFNGFLALPEEVLANESARAMQEFIEDYINKNGHLETTKTARLILLGNGGAGKTSIVNLLCDEDLVSYEKATPRIQVRDLAIGSNDEKANLNIWDFGGQVIMHSTHRFFISSRSTYIIACNQRANEQPDAWLKLLQGRISSQQIVTVLIVYTHCETAGQYGDGISAPWRRDNALKRLFKKQFNLMFFDVDLAPDGEVLGFDGLKDEIIKRGLAEAKTPMSNAVSVVKKQAEGLESQQQPFICHAELRAQLSETLKSDDLFQVLKTANHYGYIFPERPLIDENNLEDDFIWVSQKHWLTYGVYQLITNSVNCHGVFTQDAINATLSLNETLCIKQNGMIETRAPNEGEEGLLYNAQGVYVLTQILLNYRWAMSYHKRHNELLLPLATQLDEPDDFAEITAEYDQWLIKDKYNTLLMQVELVNKPADFFFKLATYFEAHLLETEHLWRTGVILHFYGNAETRALIEMPDNVLTLKVFGKDCESFQQLLLIFIKQTLTSYDHISAHSSERIWLENGKSEMLSSDVIASLTGEHDVAQQIKNQLLARAKDMTTINIHGNVTGNVGDNNQFDNQGGIHNQTFNTDSTSADLIVALQKLADAVPDDWDEKQKVLESIKAFEESIATSNEDEKKSWFRKGVEFTKDVVAIEKFGVLSNEYITVISEKIAKLLLF